MAEEESSGRAVQDAPISLLREPKSLLDSVDARIGGYGRDLNAHETLLLADERGLLGKAIGLIVPANDVVALGNAIRRLYTSPRRVLQYGRAARQRAEAEFTWDHFRERLARAYDLVLRRRSTP